MEREGLGVEIVELVVRGGLEDGKDDKVWSLLGIWSEGGGETPSTGSRGGGRHSVGVASSRFLDPVGWGKKGSVLSEPERRFSGVGDKFWGSKGGGSKLSSVWGDRLSTVTGFLGSLMV